MHCVHGSTFSNISCLTFVRYCLPSLVLFVTFNSKESKFAPTPNLHYTCDLNVFVLFEAIMLYFANVIICKDIILHIK